MNSAPDQPSAAQPEPVTYNDGINKWQDRSRAIKAAAENGDPALRRRFAERSHRHVPRAATEVEYKRLPSLKVLHEWALMTGNAYPVVEQVQDLLGLTDAEAFHPQEVWKPRYSHEHLVRQLTDLLNESIAETPSTADMAETLFASCVHTGDPGRWRVRLADIPMGWHFPYVGYHSIEFTRWYGPLTTPADDPNPNRVNELLAQADAEGVHWRETLTSRILASTPPDSFLQYGFPGEPVHLSTEPPDLDPAQRQQLWQRFTKERHELAYRIGHLLRACRGDWHGTSGRHHLPLVGGDPVLKQTTAPNPRHIRIEPTRNTAPRSSRDAQKLGSGASTLLIIGPAGIAAPRIADMVADSLGWSYMSNREMFYRMTGWRPSYGTTTAAVNNRMLRTLADYPPPQTVVYCNLNYFFDTSTPTLRFLDEALDVLRNPANETVLIAPSASPSLALWDQRQTRALYYSTGAHNAAHQTEMTHRYVEAVRGQAPSHHIAQILPLFPWTGPAVIREGAFAPEWFRHPTVGDIIVRATFEITLKLQTSAKKGTSPVVHQGSTLARHLPRLIACTGGARWSAADDVTTFDERFRRPPGPDEAPLRRHVVAFSTTD